MSSRETLKEGGLYVRLSVNTIKTICKSDSTLKWYGKNDNNHPDFLFF